jgi:hypothetical protein
MARYTRSTSAAKASATDFMGAATALQEEGAIIAKVFKQRNNKTNDNMFLGNATSFDNYTRLFQIKFDDDEVVPMTAKEYVGKMACVRLSRPSIL